MNNWTSHQHVSTVLTMWPMHTNSMNAESARAFAQTRLKLVAMVGKCCSIHNTQCCFSRCLTSRCNNVDAQEAAKQHATDALLTC